MKNNFLLFLFFSIFLKAEYNLTCKQDSIFNNFSSKISNLYNYKGFNKSYALIIGITQYAKGFRYLPNPGDPKKVQEYLLKEAKFDCVYLLTEKDVTVAKIRELMVEEFPKKLTSNDRFLFYWSGHGVTRKKEDGTLLGYLPVSSTLGKRNFADMITMKSIETWDSILPAKHTLYLLDTCVSGLAGRTAKGESNNNNENDIKKKIRKLSQRSRQLLTAGTWKENTYVVNNTQSSIFTMGLLSGLSGKADSSSEDFSKDGLITGSELESYISNYINKYIPDKLITPQLIELGKWKDNDGDFFFLVPNKNNFHHKKQDNNNHSIGSTTSKGNSKSTLAELEILAQKYYIKNIGEEFLRHGKFFKIGQIIQSLDKGVKFKYKGEELLLSNQIGIIIDFAKYDGAIKVLWMEQSFCIAKNQYSCSNKTLNMLPFVFSVNAMHIKKYN